MTECDGTTWIEVPETAELHAYVMKCPGCSNCAAPTMPDPGKNKLPGFRKGARETSRKASLAHYPKSGSARLAVLEAYTDVYPEGMTHEELSERMGNPSTSTWRARASELEEGGWLRDSSVRRKTRSGQESVVWMLTDYAAKRMNVLHRLMKGRADGKR